MLQVQRLYIAWREAMPRVHPCYAVKCNPDDGMLAVLAAMGAGFDCASEAEIEKVLALGVSPERIIYAHPCKPPKQIRFAATNGINLTTIDTVSELNKVSYTTCILFLALQSSFSIACSQFMLHFRSQT